MRCKLFKDKRGEWRWTLCARNGRKVATSGEGYKRRADCLKMYQKLVRAFAAMNPQSPRRFTLTPDTTTSSHGTVTATNWVVGTRPTSG